MNYRISNFSIKFPILKHFDKILCQKHFINVQVHAEGQQKYDFPYSYDTSNNASL